MALSATEMIFNTIRGMISIEETNSSTHARYRLNFAMICMARFAVMSESASTEVFGKLTAKFALVN